MTTDLANAPVDSWLTPRDTYLVLALAGPPPAEVHRDLANILRATAVFAHPWEPPVLTVAAPAADDHDPLAAAPLTLPQPRLAPHSGTSWFRRHSLRPHIQF
jgi:hypothetical protein